MNTVRILICATFALLVAALVHSYTSKDPGTAKQTTVEKVNQDLSIRELRQELESLKLENQRKRNLYSSSPIYNNPFPSDYSSPTLIPSNLNNANPAFVNPLAQNTATVAQPSGEMIDKLAEQAKEIAHLKALQAAANAENDMLNQEAEIIQGEILNDEPPVDAARAAVIANALVMATVQVYDPASGILVLDLVRPQNISPGQILGIRRGDTGGIIGRINMGRMENMIGYADPIAESFFGDIDIQAGDAIIVAP